MVICGLTAVCADYFPMERTGVIRIRLPVEIADGWPDPKLLEQEVPRGVQLVERVLKWAFACFDG